MSQTSGASETVGAPLVDSSAGLSQHKFVSITIGQDCMALVDKFGPSLEIERRIETDREQEFLGFLLRKRVREMGILGRFWLYLGSFLTSYSALIDG